MSAADRRRQLSMSGRHNAWDLLPLIQCPTLVLHGAVDRMTPSVNADFIAERISEAQRYIHPHGRHGFFDEFAAVLDASWG